MALDYLNSTGETDLLVRGLKQEAFDFLILFANRSNISFVIICRQIDANGEHFAFEIDPQDLKKQYFDLSFNNE